ncbi:unnamed protein product [Allacma fusca]|uniref:Uncharacterized protein n=1 Tax=Allacma fusca TaxID=39272 RepID=A0A8J2L2M9_9HEXA|nr:unnamed protein product [Allacma fusca]
MIIRRNFKRCVSELAHFHCSKEASIFLLKMAETLVRTALRGNTPKPEMCDRPMIVKEYITKAPELSFRKCTADIKCRQHDTTLLIYMDEEILSNNQNKIFYNNKSLQSTYILTELKETDPKTLKLKSVNIVSMV